MKSASLETNFASANAISDCSVVMVHLTQYLFSTYHHLHNQCYKIRKKVATKMCVIMVIIP